MKIGSKSLLYGTHQFIWHPFTVLLAWIELYGIPSWREFICILIHDLGYWGKKDLNHEEGERHPVLGGIIAKRLFKDSYYTNLCLYHSRTYSLNNNKTPSKLCWADKLSIKYDPYYLYLLRACLSGEILEYRKNNFDIVSSNKSNREWFSWLRKLLIDVAYQEAKKLK